MPWNPVFPLGTVSVRQNETIGTQNTTYIEVTMGDDPVGTNAVDTRDHFWNVGGNEDGHHRFIKSPGFVDSGGNPTDPVVGTGMGAVLYAKTTNGQVQWFTQNDDAIYQATPTVLRGTISIPSAVAYTNIIAVPANVYGEIFMYANTLNDRSVQTGFFRSDATKVQAFSNEFVIVNNRSFVSLVFGNGDNAFGLNIRAIREGATQTDWNYIITYRAL